MLRCLIGLPPCKKPEHFSPLPHSSPHKEERMPYTESAGAL